jgi:hypothetical protein
MQMVALKVGSTRDSLVLESFTCPSCGEPVVSMLKGTAALTSGNPMTIAYVQDVERWFVYPRSAVRPVSAEVPPELASDYREAAAVLDLSPKASAALSRRCLQNTIRSVLAISRATLQAEIAEVIAAGVVSSSLGSDLDALRVIGNFAAHPTKDTQTAEIIDVEPGEAEWNLDLLDRLFDELIVAPARSAARKAALNAKLRAAGKPEIP